MIVDDSGSVVDGVPTGLLGMVHRGEVDIGASTMRYLPERMAMVDFAYPIWYYRQIYTLAKPNVHLYRHFAFTPFDPIVWLLLVISVLLSVLVDWVIRALLLLRDRTTKRRLFAVVDSLQNYFGMLLKQDVNMPRFASCTTIVWFYAFFSLITTNYYQSVMTRMLLLPLSPRVPFRNIEQLVSLLERKEKTLVYFYPGYEPTYPDSLKARFKASLMRNPIHVPESFPDLLDFITRHGGVFYGSEFDDKVPFQVSDSDRKNRLITIRDDSIASSFGSFILPKNSSYKNRFNSGLMRVLPGVNRIKGRYEYQKPFRSTELSASFETVILTLDHMWEVFTIWLIGSGLAVLCCFLELYGWRRERKRMAATYEKNAIGLLFNHLTRLQQLDGRSIPIEQNSNFSLSASSLT